MGELMTTLPVVYPISAERGRRARRVWVRCIYCSEAHPYMWSPDLPHPGVVTCLAGLGAMFVRAPVGWRAFEVQR